MQLTKQSSIALLTSLEGDLVETLRSASGFNTAQFDRHIQPLVDRLAECVQALPLSRDAYCEQGGALRFGVVSGLMAFRLADSTIFAPNHTAETRRVLDPQYRYSGFAAALASVPAILEAVAIVTVAGRRWSPLSEVSLTQALADAGVQDYVVNWNPTPRAPSRMVAALLAGRFFAPGGWGDFEESVIGALADAILPVRGAIAVEAPLCRVVRVAQDKAFEIDGKERARRIDELGAPRLALRELLALPEAAGAPAPAPAPVPPTQAAAARASGGAPTPAAQSSKQAGGDGMPPLSPLVSDLLKAIRVDKDVARIRADCSLGEEGFRFPKKALARYGMAPATATKLLVDEGLVRDQTTTHLVLVPAVGVFLFGEEAA
ncbi:TraI domain-containing protein [Cupriavidus basilensis]|uniref:TraI domain-containing protein n=1 Tax=Cupriavidus basilensis TaxID=68895 RepID=UPI0020A6ACB9|nr:TraI domain-containing protein [Cupriavidus basilensis]MCP3023788.1 TraI domain-containing protein [Cupriavidus basilensis]